MATEKDTTTPAGVTRRGFLGAVGLASAAPLFPTLPTHEAAPLDPVRSWYTSEVDRIVRAWEPRFRFRQYRPDEDGDWEGERIAPRESLENALWALPLFREASTACLILAVTPSEYEDGQAVRGQAVFAMGQDAIAHAERLGYFAVPCPESLRFPDLPDLGLLDRQDDRREAARELESARNCMALVENARDGIWTAEEVAEHKERLARAEARIAAMDAGTIPARTEREKVETWHAGLLAIVADYRRRLEAAGLDASWVALPKPWEVVRLDQGGALFDAGEEV